MRNEIGGFFEYPDLSNSSEIECSVYKKLIRLPVKIQYKPRTFNDGRQALKFILDNLDIIQEKTLAYLPSFLCDSIIKPFKELKIGYSFYKLKDPLSPILPDTEKSIILIIDYFGNEAISNEEIINLTKQNNTILIDITHSLLNSTRFKIKCEKVILFASLRKIFPIPDGGVTYFPNNFKFLNHFENENIKRPNPMLKAMKLKKKYLNFDWNNKTEFLNIYNEYEKKKDEKAIVIQKISSKSIDILKQLDFGNLGRLRFKNMQFLRDNLKKELLLYNSDSDTITAYFPLKFKNLKKRNQIRDVLIQNNIYSPIHWVLPNEIPLKCKYSWDLSQKILSIPIDHRYDVKHMKKIVKTINSGLL